MFHITQRGRIKPGRPLGLLRLITCATCIPQVPYLVPTYNIQGLPQTYLEQHKINLAELPNLYGTLSRLVKR